MSKINNKINKVVWLQGIFSEDAVNSSNAISAAANIWQSQLIKSLINQDLRILYLGHKFEQVWPRGRLRIKANLKDKVPDLDGTLLSYLNVPYLRNIILRKKYQNYLVKKLKITSGDIIVTYNDSFICRILKKIKKKENFKWISIVADLKYPKGADGYIYLSWDYYNRTRHKQKKIHIDGGVTFNNLKLNKKFNTAKKIIMYTGQIGGHGGLSILLNAFDQLNYKEVELWICGKGYDPSVKKFESKNKSIKLFGFVTKNKLHYLSSQADIFVNPRERNGNEKNFPSKILHYLAYLKPIITTSSGLSKKYGSVCNVLADDNVETLKIEILKCLNLSNNEVKDISEKIQSFNMQNTWSVQAKKFKNWLEVEII